MSENTLAYLKHIYINRGLSALDAELCAALQAAEEERALRAARSKVFRKGTLASVLHFDEQVGRTKISSLYGQPA